MAPHSESHAVSTTTDGQTVPVPVAQPDAVKTESVKDKTSDIPRPLTFEDKYEEREYLRGRLALGFRVFGKFGFDEGLAGHMTVRDPVDSKLFWTNPVGIPFSMMKKSDLILVNYSGEVQDGGANRLVNTAAYCIHSGVHKARQDVRAAAHTHSIYGRTFSTLGRTLDSLTQDSCAFHNDHVLHDTFNGVVLEADEGKAIAERLGDKKAAILQNHGLLTVGKTIEECVFWFVSLEKCCQVQLMAEAAASAHGQLPVKINDEAAASAYKSVGNSLTGWFSGQPLFKILHEETKGEYLN